MEEKDTNLKAYVTDLFEKFNVYNLQGYVDDLIFLKSKNVIFALVAKLLIYIRNLGRRECSHFPNLLNIVYMWKLCNWTSKDY